MVHIITRSPLFVILIYRIRTYEHEAMWGKALTSYDLHSTLPEVTRQVGIVEVKTMKALSHHTVCRALMFCVPQPPQW